MALGLPLLLESTCVLSTLLCRKRHRGNTEVLTHKHTIHLNIASLLHSYCYFIPEIQKQQTPSQTSQKQSKEQNPTASDGWACVCNKHKHYLFLSGYAVCLGTCASRHLAQVFWQPALAVMHQ